MTSLLNNDTEKTFPYDLVHYGGVSNRDIHNMYNLLQIMATHILFEQILNFLHDNNVLSPQQFGFRTIIFIPRVHD
jgi:hypothetical protein